MYVGKRKSRTRHPGESSDRVPSLNGKYEAWHWMPDLQVIHAPLLGHLGDPSDIVGRLSVGRLHIQESEKPSTACNCILNSWFDFQRLYTFMYTRWLQHVRGSNITQIIDIPNVLIHRTLQFMMSDDFRIELSLFSLPSANDEQIPRLILGSVLQQAYLP